MAIDDRGLFWSVDEKEVWGLPTDGRDPSALVAYSHGRQRQIAKMPTEVTLCGLTREAGALMILGWSDRSVRAMPPGGAGELKINLDAAPQGFSADGRRLVLIKLRAPRIESDVYLQELDGSAPILLGKGYVRGRLWMAITPDGRWVQVNRESGAVLIPTGAGQERAVEFPGLVGPLIVACIGEKWLIRAGVPGKTAGFHAFYLADPGTGRVEKLKLEESGDKSRVMASPDGSRVLFGDFRGKWSVAMLDGNGAMASVQAPSSEEIYGWTADSRGLFVGKQAGPELTVEVCDLETGRRKPWKIFTSGRPDVTLDGLCLTPDGSAWAYSRSRFIERLILAQGLR
jgi:hypothetical protein